MSKWDRLIKYLNTTTAKPDAVLASIKAVFKPRGSSTIKYTDTYITRKTYAYIVCHAIYNAKIDNKKKSLEQIIRDLISSQSFKINYQMTHLIKKRNPKNKKMEYYGDDKGFNKKTNEQHYNAVKKLWNTNKKIRKELDSTKGAMPGVSMAILAHHLETN